MGRFSIPYVSVQFTFSARSDASADINSFLVCGSPVEYADVGLPVTRAARIETATAESTSNLPVTI